MQEFSASSYKTKRADTYKGCHNCVHRFGLLRDFWKCSRTGWFTDVEMKFGGRCAEGKVGSDLRLWAQRPSLVGRVIGLVYQPSPINTSSQEGQGL
jgi:hypothetical protein